MHLLLSLFIAVIPIWSDPPAERANGEIKVVDFKGLQKHLDQYGDKTLVINFWATWCVPCVRELPYFEQATEYYADQGVEVILVSLDFSKQIETRLKPFLAKHELKSHVVLLDDPDANAWIDKVSPEWSGAIPATLIRKNGVEAFYEKSFHSFDELKEIIQPFIKS